MDDVTLRKNIAKNLIYYRRKKGLTQAALAATLNYSDKSVSKWERGEGLPDVTVLVLLADYYGVTLNDLVTQRITEEASENSETSQSVSAAENPESVQGDAVQQSGTLEKPRTQRSLRTRIMVPVLSVGLVWLAAMLGYFFVKVICPTFSYAELIFLYAIPASCIVATVFACLWWNSFLRLLFVSGIIWSVALSLFVTFSAIPFIGLIFAVAGVLQVLTILWFIQIKK